MVEDDGDDEEESRERETLKQLFAYSNNVQPSTLNLKLCLKCYAPRISLSFGSPDPIIPFLFVQRGKIYLATLRSAPEGRNIRTDFVPKIFKEDKIQFNALLTIV